MAGDILQVGISGLRAFQRTLGTIGHNISNANTEGYSRQKVDLLTRPATPSGAGFMGNGVDINTTERMFNQNAINQVRSRTSTKEFFSAYNEFASQVDNLIADADAGLTPAIESFFESVQEVSNDPTSIAARTVMITDAENMVNRFSTMDSWFSDLNKAANNRIVNQVGAVNELSSSIAAINQEIIVATGLGGNQPPNDLLDKRDLLIDQLAEKINVSVVETNNGSLDVFIGNGQSIVLGTQSMRLEARQDPDDPQIYEVSYVDPSTNVLSPISTMLSGGDLGGVIKFRDEILKPSMNGLGRIAIAISSTFNTQHRNGLDLNNAMGTDFFNQPSLGANESTSNAGGSLITVTLNDIQALTLDEYQLTYDGANYQLRNENTNQVTTLNIAVAGPPIQFDPVFGMDISLDSVPVTGDTFFIRPTREAARNLSVSTRDPSEIAAANVLKTGANISNNLGSASINEATVTDNTNPDLQEQVTITFSRADGLGSPNTADQYTAVGVPSGNTVTAAYTSGGTISFNGWDVNISGAAIVGDEFVVEQNTSGISDNRNALLLADLQFNNTMLSGNATYHDAYGEIVVSVGNRTSQSEISFEAQSALLSQAEGLRDSISGVNLDEEAANLLRFQQAYAAAAQVITAADELFQTLLGAVRR